MFIITLLSNSIHKLQTPTTILSADELSEREITAASPDAAFANNVLESRGKVSDQQQ